MLTWDLPPEYRLPPPPRPPLVDTEPKARPPSFKPHPERAPQMNTFTYEDKPEEKVLIYDLGYPLGGRLETSSAATDSPTETDK